jgi:soluble lytic murein transglycosylase-like protein
MQTSVPQRRKRVFSSEHLLTQERKAALGAAFRWSPVALAILLCSTCISFLLTIQPTSATTDEQGIHSEFQSNQSNYNHNDYSPNNGKHTSVSPVFTKEVLYWEKEILSWSNSHQLDPNLVAVVIQIESCGHPQVESRVGAKGLFQVMPFHFSKDEDPFNPETNAQRGLAYLSKALKLAKGDPKLALAGYNGGHSVIPLDPAFWAEETRRYVYWGSGILDDISAGKSQSSRLDEWISAGGKSLCQRSSVALGF